MSYLYLIAIITFFISYFVSKYEKININVFFILNILTILSILIESPFLTILCPIIISQTLIDFNKLELSDINNLMICIVGLIYGYVNQFDIKAIILTSLFFVIIYILPISNLGFGDVKYAMVLSFFLKSKQIPSFIFYSCLIGLIIGVYYKIIKKENIFPMGPALGFTIILYFI